MFSRYINVKFFMFKLNPIYNQLKIFICFQKKTKTRNKDRKPIIITTNKRPPHTNCRITNIFPFFLYSQTHFILTESNHKFFHREENMYIYTGINSIYTVYIQHLCRKTSASPFKVTLMTSRKHHGKSRKTTGQLPQTATVTEKEVPPTVFFKLKKHRMNSEREEERRDNKLTQSFLYLKISLENRIFTIHFTPTQKSKPSQQTENTICQNVKSHTAIKKRFGNIFPNLFHFI